MDWQLQITLHYPHERFALGWEFIPPDEQERYYTYRLYLFIVTLTLDVK